MPIDEIFVIERIWTDFRESGTDPVGYTPIGFAETENQARDFCSKGRTYTSKDFWAIVQPLPEYRFTPLSRIAKP